MKKLFILMTLLATECTVMPDKSMDQFSKYIADALILIAHSREIYQRHNGEELRYEYYQFPGGSQFLDLLNKNIRTRKKDKQFKSNFFELVTIHLGNGESTPLESENKEWFANDLSECLFCIARHMSHLKFKEARYKKRPGKVKYLFYKLSKDYTQLQRSIEKTESVEQITNRALYLTCCKLRKPYIKSTDE